MPMWCPPTPPHSENDMYVDQSVCFLYDSAVMTEAQLPPVYVKKEKKRRQEHQPSGLPKKKSKVVTEELSQQAAALTNRPPRSLFDRPQLLKLRREKTLLRNGMAGQLGMKMGASGNLQRPGSSDSNHQDQPEWLIHEDWSLLQAVQALLQLPLNLVVTSPAHIPNWDLVSDIVSTTSRIYRSPKQCKTRYETVIIPREEGKLTFDANPRKPPKKIPKAVYKTKGNKPLRTGQLYTQDSGSSVTTLHAFRFDCIKNVASKRTPTLRPTLVNPTMKNPKHAAVIADSGIQYDSPMNPEEVARIRQERIKNEKTKAAEQQRAAANQSAVRTHSTAVQLQQLPVSGATAIISPATKHALQASGVSIARNNSIVVSNSYALNRKLQGQSATSVISGVTPVTQATGRKMTVQEIQQLRNSSTTMAQLMKQVHAGGGSVTGVSQGGTPRTITVQQQHQPISIGGTVKPQQFSQLNLLSQHQAKHRTSGTTLVAQRTGTAQLLSGQQLQHAGLDQSRLPTLVKTVSSVAAGSATFGTTNMTIPVSTGVNINVSMPQQQKAISAISKASLTGNPTHQFRQIQLLHNKQVTTGSRPQQLQKLSLSHHPQLVGKSGASVQIVQQKIGGKQIGVQQIQQLIKQQQAQHAQIITTPGGASGGSASVTGSGQTIIATSQLITPSNMHATITKMSAPNSNASSGAVSNVTVSLARPVITSHSAVAIVPGVGTAGSSLVTQSPSKLVAPMIARPTTHRVAGAITGIVAGGNSAGSTSVVSLASVTVQGLQQSQASVSASLMGQRTLSANAIQAFQQASSQVAARAAGVVSHSAAPASGGTTVLQQTILANKPSAASHIAMSATSIVQATKSTPTPSTITRPSIPSTHSLTVTPSAATTPVASKPPAVSFKPSSTVMSKASLAVSSKPSAVASKPSVVAPKPSVTPTSVPTPTNTPSIVAQTVPVVPTVVVPVDSQLATLSNVGSTVTVATTPSHEEPVGVSASLSTPPQATRSDSPVPNLSDLQASTPDATRTYAMRPRKTN